MYDKAGNKGIKELAARMARMSRLPRACLGELFSGSLSAATCCKLKSVSFFLVRAKMQKSNNVPLHSSTAQITLSAQRFVSTDDRLGFRRMISSKIQQVFV
jgi:hypothetical protein